MNIEPLTRPPNAVVEVPGSKSITNRALVCAALAGEECHLRGVLVADDTHVMLHALRALGFTPALDRAWRRVFVRPGGSLRHGPVTVDAGLSGTTARFLLPVLALGAGPYTLDGGPPLRRRPLAALAAAVRDLGAVVEGDSLPLTVRGPAQGGQVAVPGDVTSQFVSALLLAGPCLRSGIDIVATTPLVSQPYVTMTAAVMRVFGATVDGLRVEPTGYAAATFDVEPDASAASYFFTAAAITGGRVTVRRLRRPSLQGDTGFADVLARMGASVTEDADGLTVEGTGTLHGGTFDLRDMPDMAQTLAVAGVFADAPVTVTGVAFIRGHETDRITAVVTELGRCGIEAEEHDDGFTVHPGRPRAARVETYQDHRMAMSFALLGLVVPGIEIVDPGCVSKTFPSFFEVLGTLR